MNNEKPTDVSEVEWRIGRFVVRVAEFLALCAAMIALQAFLTVFNPANPPDTNVAHKADKGAYLACIAAAQNLQGLDWQMAARLCSKRFHESTKKTLDLPPR